MPGRGSSPGAGNIDGTPQHRETTTPLHVSGRTPRVDGHAGQQRDASTLSPRWWRRFDPIPRAPQRYLLGNTMRPSQTESQSNSVFEVTRQKAMKQVELQIEVMPPFAGQLMVYLWYVVLIIAVIVQAVDFVAWNAVNICGGPAADIRDYDKWTSSCATAVQNEDGFYNVRWDGGPYDVDFESVFVRLTRVVISLRAPDHWVSSDTDEVRYYPIQVQLPGVFNLSNAEHLGHLSIGVTCTAKFPRCHHVDLDREAVLNITDDGYASILLKNVPPEIARRANESSIGILYQKPGYMLGTAIWRYVALLFSVIHLIRFVAYKEFASTLYEQKWAMGLQIALIWYLDPLFALSIVYPQPSATLTYMEFYIPSLFLALVIGFMLSVVTASMPWTSAKGEQQAVKYNLMTWRGLKGYLCDSHSIFDPPIWSKAAISLFIIIVVSLDIVSEVLYGARGVDSTIWQNSLYYTSAALMLCGTVVCSVLIFHLHRNLGKKSYLDSRPQQLACRVFIIVLPLTIIYFIYDFIVFFQRYLTIPGMVVFQPMVQLPAIMVSTFFVNIMTLVYTTQKRSELVPLHPRNQKWKQVVWPDAWYRWLSYHGSSMYIFRSELEENFFLQNQCQYRMRQFWAKRKRLVSPHRRVRSRVAGGHAVEPTSRANRNGDLGVNAMFSRTVSFVLPRVDPMFPLPQPVHSAQPSSCSIDMDATSLFFLPPAAGESTEMVRSAPAFNASAPFHLNHEVDDPPMRRVALVNNDVESVCTRSIVHHNPAGTLCNLSTPRCNPQSEAPIGLVHEESTMQRDADFLSSEGSVDDDYKQGKFLVRVLSRVRNAFRSVMRTAERTFIDLPLHALEIAETAILDSAIRRFRGKEYLPFFNLETAIDCFNHSWEAYGKADRPEMNVKHWKKDLSMRRVHGMPHVTGIPTENNDERATVPNVENDEAVTMNPTERDMREPTMEGIDEPMSNTAPVDLNASPPINVERYGYELLHVAKRKDVQVIITRMNMGHANHKGKTPRIVVAFRGTVSMSNAWHDARVRRVVWDEMAESGGSASLPSRFCCDQNPTVHTGFLDVWNAHRDHVHEAVWKQLSTDESTVYRVFTTGHSLGGSLATLCAYSLRKMLFDKKYPLPEVTVYTFGQPPLGNKAFQKTYDRSIPRHFRVVNESDTVALIRMYGCHVGVEVDVDRHGNYICQPTYIERMFRPTKGKGFSVGNHLMLNYADSLNAIGRIIRCPVTAFRGDIPVEEPLAASSGPHQPQEPQDSRESGAFHEI